MILLYVPCKNVKEAKRIGKELIKKKLIACANHFPISSSYVWLGKLEIGKEIVLLCKTNKNNAPNCVKVIKKLHSYAVPCILGIKTQANKEYEKWANEIMR